MKTSYLMTCLCAALMFVAPGCTESSSSKAELKGQAADESVQADQALPNWTASNPDLGHEKQAHEKVPGIRVLESKYPSLLALSSEEAAWLDRNGYPTQEEMDALPTYDVNALENGLRERKELKAAALLGHRLMLDGDMDGAWAAFAAGANLGSLYARQQMAIVGAHRIASMSPREDAASDPAILGPMIAQLHVARMLGDHRAQSLIDRHSADFNWEYYGRNVLNQTARFMDEIGRHAQLKGRRAIGPDPRPNAYEWDQMEKDPGARVSLYTRSRPNP